MPYDLRPSGAGWELRLWPHNALGPRGFAAAIGVGAAALALPLLALLGQAALWGLLPFAGLALWGLWAALRRNRRDRSVTERLYLSRGGLHLRRTDPDGRVRDWRADPAWVALRLTPRGGPVPQYLTLTGGGREVELGAFLTPGERVALNDELSALLVALKGYA